MGVKVYGTAKAASPQRVLACLVELDVDFELIHVDLDSGEHQSPAFLSRQPFGQVPVIEDGDFRLYESRAIIRYLARKHADKNPTLQGTTLEERATVDQWLEMEARNFKSSTVSSSSKVEMGKVLDVYEQRLSKSKYLAGDNFTLADLTHLPGLMYLAQDAGLGYLIAERKNVSAWWDSISSRPAWKRVLQMALIN